MPAQYTDKTEITIDFTDDSWLNAFPDVYTVTNDSSKPWYSANTFKYNEMNTLRSGSIGNSSSTIISVSFRLVEDGNIEFNWAVSSENNYDKLIVSLDGKDILTKSGQQTAFTTVNTQIVAGEHTITFKYTKDSSQSHGSDAAAIGYIKLVGVMPNFDNYFILYDKSQSKYYAVLNNSLTEIPLDHEPTLQDFIDYGGPKPMNSMLLNISRFKLLKCATTNDIAKVSLLQYTIQANVKPILLRITQEIKLDKQYQVGFSYISLNIEKKDSTLFKLVLSPDGTNWYAYNVESTSWQSVDYSTEAVLQNGMTQSTLSSLNDEIFEALYTEHNTRQMYLAFVMQCTELDNWLIKSISVGYKLAQQGGN